MQVDSVLVVGEPCPADASSQDASVLTLLSALMAEVPSELGVATSLAVAPPRAGLPVVTRGTIRFTSIPVLSGDDAETTMDADEDAADSRVGASWRWRPSSSGREPEPDVPFNIGSAASRTPCDRTPAAGG